MTAAKTPKGAVMVDVENPEPEHLTSFEEDDDPLSLAGDFVDEDGDGVDDREQK